MFLIKINISSLTYNSAALTQICKAIDMLSLFYNDRDYDLVCPIQPQHGYFNEESKETELSNSAADFLGQAPQVLSVTVKQSHDCFRSSNMDLTFKEQVIYSRAVKVISSYFDKVETCQKEVFWDSIYKGFSCLKNIFLGDVNVLACKNKAINQYYIEKQQCFEKHSFVLNIDFKASVPIQFKKFKNFKDINETCDAQEFSEQFPYVDSNHYSDTRDEVIQLENMEL